jgi:hypothetical protein
LALPVLDKRTVRTKTLGTIPKIHAVHKAGDITHDAQDTISVTVTHSDRISAREVLLVPGVILKIDHLHKWRNIADDADDSVPVHIARRSWGYITRCLYEIDIITS